MACANFFIKPSPSQVFVVRSHCGILDGPARRERSPLFPCVSGAAASAGQPPTAAPSEVSATAGTCRSLDAQTYCQQYNADRWQSRCAGATLPVHA